MKIDLSNKIALVIGGTGVIGTAVCKQLFLSGAKVVTDYQTQNIDQWLSSLSIFGVSVLPFKANIIDFDDCVKLVEEVEQTIGPIDIIINSNDLDESIPFAEMTKAQWDNVISHNIDALYNVCRNLAERMGNRGYGRIINISSIISRMGKSEKTHLAAAKAGMHGFSMALSQELARKGVTVNTVSPGDINTLCATKDSESNPTTIKSSADEIAYLVDFLCSDQARCINGADIAINGGQYLH
jgi:acetoacetyl-CoA reductase